MPIQGLKFNIPTGQERHLSFQATGSFTAYNPNDGYALIALDRTASPVDYDHKLPSQSGGQFPGPINSYLSIYYLDQGGGGISGQIIVYASPQATQIPQFWSIGRAVQTQVTAMDIVQGSQPGNPPASVGRLWVDNNYNLHLLHSDGTDQFEIDNNDVLGGILSGTLLNPQFSNGPLDAPAMIRVTGLGNYNSSFGAGIEIYYSPVGASGNGYFQCYDRSGGGSVARDIYFQGLANLRLNPNGYTYISRANFQTNIVTNSYQFDTVHSADWFRADTAGYGIYNNANSQGIGFGASGPYDYATGKTLAKLPIQQADIGATQISWDKTVAPNQASAFTYIGGNQAAPSGSSTSTSYVFVPAPFNGVSVDIRRGSGQAIVDGIFHITCNTGTTVSIAYAWDGGGLTTIFANGVPASATTIPFSFYTSVSGWGAGAHTLQFYWATNGGTLNWRTDVYSWCRVWEQRA